MTCIVWREKIAIRSTVLLALLALATDVVQSAGAQDVPATPHAQERASDSLSANADVRFSLEATSRFGIFTYVPEE